MTTLEDNRHRVLWIVTGPPRSGKTTLLLRVFHALRKENPEIPVEGFLTLEVREHTYRTGFDILVLPEEKRILFARKSPWFRKRAYVEMEAKHAGYGLWFGGLSQILAGWLQKRRERSGPPRTPEVFFLDEIGNMEWKSGYFRHWMHAMVEAWLSPSSRLWSLYSFWICTIGQGFWAKWQCQSPWKEWIETAQGRIILQSSSQIRERAYSSLWQSLNEWIQHLGKYSLLEPPEA